METEVLELNILDIKSKYEEYIETCQEIPVSFREFRDKILGSEYEKYKESIYPEIPMTYNKYERLCYKKSAGEIILKEGKKMIFTVKINNKGISGIVCQRICHISKDLEITNEMMCKAVMMMDDFLELKEEIPKEKCLFRLLEITIEYDDNVLSYDLPVITNGWKKIDLKPILHNVISIFK